MLKSMRYILPLVQIIKDTAVQFSSQERQAHIDTGLSSCLVSHSSVVRLDRGIKLQCPASGLRKAHRPLLIVGETKEELTA